LTARYAARGDASGTAHVEVVDIKVWRRKGPACASQQQRGQGQAMVFLGLGFFHNFEFGLIGCSFGFK
jgi:hypothetical protein